MATTWGMPSSWTSCAWRGGQLRASDAVARWGGEEFIVLSPATRIDGAMSLAEKIRDAVATHKFPGIAGMTVSIGVAEYVAGEDLTAWIQRADEALYKAKSGGRNLVMVSERGGEADVPPSSLIEIAWEEAFACGHPTIDGQHHQLFTLANSLIGAVSSNQPLAETAMRLRRLMAHTAQHFHDEEALLARVGFPGLQAHAAEHRRLLEKASQFESDVGSGKADFSQFVGFLILDLVQGHILIEDKHFFGYFHPAPRGAQPPFPDPSDPLRIW